MKEPVVLAILAISSVLFIPSGESADVLPNISAAQFTTWFEAARDRRLAIPQDVRSTAACFRYVLINGLDLGTTQGCFVQNVKELQAQGVAQEMIHRIDPSPRKTVAENAGTMRKELLEIASRGPEPLVLIAHSRGACDTLAFALMNPRFVVDRVRAIFLIQGPFGGSAAADYAAGEGSAVDRRMPPLYRLGVRVVGQLEARFLDSDKHAVIRSLSRSASARFWEELLRAHRDALPIVGPKVFYVTSQTRPSRHPLLQRVAAWYVDTYYGPNDGLIALEDQSLADLGTVLAVLDAGHTDLTHRFPSARPQKRLRQALIDAILMAVGEARAGSTEEADAMVPTSYQERRPMGDGGPVESGASQIIPAPADRRRGRSGAKGQGTGTRDHNIVKGDRRVRSASAPGTR
jgi:pimeloyl-ACP methyl ester carboxylesterase